MKQLHLFFFVFINISVTAQNKDFISAESCPFELGKPVAVTKAEDDFNEAKVSPDGTKLLLSRNYDGLYILDLNKNNKIIKVNDETMAGYCASWTCTKDEITFKSKKLTPGRQFVIYNIEKKTLRKRETLHNHISVKFNLRKDIIEATDGTKTWNITNEPGEYYRLIISPDSTRILAHKNDGKMYIFSLDGSGLLAKLGNGLCQCWTQDSKYLIYFISHDNGDYNIDSDIYICKADGSKKWKLTNTSDKLEMWPHISANGKKLTFYDEKSRRIFVADVTKKLD